MLRLHNEMIASYSENEISYKKRWRKKNGHEKSWKENGIFSHFSEDVYIDLVRATDIEDYNCCYRNVLIQRMTVRTNATNKQYFTIIFHSS